MDLRASLVWLDHQAQMARMVRQGLLVPLGIRASLVPKDQLECTVFRASKVFPARLATVGHLATMGLLEIRLTLISTVTTMMTITVTMALTTTPYLHHQELPAN